MSPLEITLVILLVTIIAFVSGKVPFSVISTGIILALILTGIKTPAEAFGGFINTNVVMFVAMFVIGAGLTKTPLIDKAQSLVIRYKDNMRMSNLATLTIFIPLVTSACIRMGVDPRAAVVGVITASCVSIMTPMAAPCQIMIIEPGGYTLKDYLKCGTPLALILIVVSVFFLPTLYPFA